MQNPAALAMRVWWVSPAGRAIPLHGWAQALRRVSVRPHPVSTVMSWSVPMLTVLAGQRRRWGVMALLAGMIHRLIGGLYALMEITSAPAGLSHLEYRLSCWLGTLAHRSPAWRPATARGWCWLYRRHVFSPDYPQPAAKTAVSTVRRSGVVLPASRIEKLGSIGKKCRVSRQLVLMAEAPAI